MHTDFEQRPNRDQVATTQHIRSPLTQVAYSRAAKTHHLLVLFTGRVHLDGGHRADGDAIAGPRLIWMPVGSSKEISMSSGARGILLSLPEIAFVRALPLTPLGDQMRRAFSQNLSLPLEDPDFLLPLIEGLEREWQQPAAASSLAHGHYLGLLLIQLWRLLRAHLTAHGRAPQGLAERFVILVGQNILKHWKVQAYADALGVSRDRLGTAVQRSTGYSPQHYLHRELTKEAAELLANTGMPISHVAFRLGFSDPGYFNRFFKRMTGSSPGRFRRQAKTRTAGQDLAYAAWP